jgi:hypothetical protein
MTPVMVSPEAEPVSESEPAPVPDPQAARESSPIPITKMNSIFFIIASFP